MHYQQAGTNSKKNREGKQVRRVDRRWEMMSSRGGVNTYRSPTTAGSCAGSPTRRTRRS